MFSNLVAQAEQLGIPVLSELPSGEASAEFGLVVDAIFGFSFKGQPREPFASILESLRISAVPVLSVDIPSGWDVEFGPQDGDSFMPDALISLTAPKLAARFFSREGGRRHFVGGRFVPPSIVDAYQLVLPKYPGTAQIVEI